MRVRLSVLLLLGKVVRLLPRWCRLLRLEPVAALQPLALDLVGRATSRPRSFGRCQRQWIRKQSDVRPAGRDHVTAVVGKEAHYPRGKAMFGVDDRCSLPAGAAVRRGFSSSIARRHCVNLPRHGSPSETQASPCFHPSSGVRHDRSRRRISAPSPADALGSTNRPPGPGTARRCRTDDWRLNDLDHRVQIRLLCGQQQ